jgi:hypothetical protein
MAQEHMIPQMREEAIAVDFMKCQEPNETCAMVS